MVGKIKFEDRIRELVVDHTLVAAIVGPLLEARAALRAQFAKLHRMLLDLVHVDPSVADDVQGRTDRRAHVPNMRRQSRTILKIQVRGCSLRTYAAHLSVRRNLPDGPYLPMWGCHAEIQPLRSSPRRINRSRSLESTQGLGNSGQLAGVATQKAMVAVARKLGLPPEKWSSLN